MTPYEILTAAQELIRDPENLTASILACDRSGSYVEPWSDQAVKWCAIGAPQKFYGRPLAGEMLDLLQDSSKAVSGHGIIWTVKNCQHIDVMRMFDLAREKAKAAEAA